MSVLDPIWVPSLLKHLECLSVLSLSVHYVCLLERVLSLVSLDELESLLEVLGLDQGCETRLNGPRLTCRVHFQY